MRPVRIAAFVSILLTAGCTGVERAPPREPPPTGAVPGGAIAVAPVTPAAPAPPESPPAPVTIEPAAPSATQPAAPSIAKAEPPSAKPPAKAPPPRAPAAQPRPQEKAAPAPAAQAAPLDLKSLETQLRETKAIGVLTKIALKNQVDDLLSRFRGYYQGQIKTSLAELRQAYDLLFLKVLSLVQDGDPPLARAIVASREAIWGILADPVKFVSQFAAL